jgi:MFS family permease
VRKRQSQIALDWLNFFMADVETGIGPFVANYLSAAHHFNPAQVGVIVGAQNLAEVAAQAPAGFLIDRVRHKRWLIAGAALVISVGALFIVARQKVKGQIANQIAIGMAAAFVSPTIAAISLGMVGRQAFARRVGRNAAFSHGGNVATALLAGVLGYAAGQQWVFYVSAMPGVMVLGSLFFLREQDIDHKAARGAREDSKNAHGGVRAPWEVLRKTRIVVFALIIGVFHFANSAMLPLAAQELAKLDRGASSLYMSACIVTAQMVMVPVSYGAGRVADRFGRKPLFSAAFVFLFARGVLLALRDHPFSIVGAETLDGAGTAIASVIALLIVSDLAHGTGRFNFMQGLMNAAIGIGAFAGNTVTGTIAKSAGFPVAFSVLAGVAVAGFVLFAALMPETRQGLRP